MSRRLLVTDHAFGGVEGEAEVAARFGAEFAEHQARDQEEAAVAVAGADVVLVNLAPITENVLTAMAPRRDGGPLWDRLRQRRHRRSRQLGVSVANSPRLRQRHRRRTHRCLLAGAAPQAPDVRPGCPYRGVVRRQQHEPLDRFHVDDRRAHRHRAHRPGRGQPTPPVRLPVFTHDPYADQAVPAERGVRAVALVELLSTASAISLHAPLTPATHCLLNADRLAQTRPGVIVVNTSHGGLVDEEALADAVERGHVQSAALDVFDPEPLAAGSRLRSLPQVLLTPHAAFYSDDSLAALQRLICDEAARARRRAPALRRHPPLRLTRRSTHPHPSPTSPVVRTASRPKRSRRHRCLRTRDQQRKQHSGGNGACLRPINPFFHWTQRCRPQRPRSRLPPAGFSECGQRVLRETFPDAILIESDAQVHCGSGWAAAVRTDS